MSVRQLIETLNNGDTATITSIIKKDPVGLILALPRVSRARRDTIIKAIEQEHKKRLAENSVVMTCANCGKTRDYELDAKFCIKCGQPTLVRKNK